MSASQHDWLTGRGHDFEEFGNDVVVFMGNMHDFRVGEGLSVVAVIIIIII